MSHETYALVGLAITLLGVIITSTWKFSSLATHLTDTINGLERKDKELEEKIKYIDSIPQLTLKVEHLEKNHSLIPKLMSRTDVIEEKIKHSKEIQKVLLRQSRPDEEGND